MDYTTIIPLVLVPCIRSVGGWINSSLEDGKISGFELAQLGSTIVRVGLIGAGTYFGLNGLGIDVSAIGASASALVLDFILSGLKKVGIEAKE
jgi:hypothetical protein